MPEVEEEVAEKGIFIGQGSAIQNQWWKLSVLRVLKTSNSAGTRKGERGEQEYVAQEEENSEE